MDIFFPTLFPTTAARHARICGHCGTRSHDQPRAPQHARLLHRVGVRLLCFGAAVLLGALPFAVFAEGEAARTRPGNEVELGRYLVKTAGCNDCHTPGYIQQDGKSAEANWLTGDALGWQGPWGTTYATNLRLLFATLSERQWLTHARTMTPRPPMPWFNVRAMSERDLRAIYRYIRSAGPAGDPAPAYVPPGHEVAGPVVRFP